MSYTVGDIRRWDVSALAGAGAEVGRRASTVEGVRSELSDGAASLDDGWDGLAADAVVDAVEGEKRHVTHLADGLVDLADVLARAEAALWPAVQTVKDRIADAEAIGSAIETVRSLDEHYGREIDGIATQLHNAIPSEVDRSPIPGSDDPWPGRALDAVTGAASQGYKDFADELDPRTRGRHKLNPVPDNFGRAAAGELRLLGRIAGPLGGGFTVYDGVKAHAEGKTSTSEAIVETGSALGGGMLGGMAGGAAVGSFFGPVGTLLGAGIGAVVGTYLGQKAGDAVHDEFMS